MYSDSSNNLVPFAVRYSRLSTARLDGSGARNVGIGEFECVFWWHKPLDVQEPVRMYFRSLPSTVNRRTTFRWVEQNSEITAYYVICKVGKSLKEYTTGLFYEGVLLALPIMLTLCALLPFPLGLIFLLRFLRTIPVTEEPSSARRGLIAVRIVLSFLYGLTSYIAGWLRCTLSF